MLRTAKNIAVVGMSDKPHRASHNIGRYLAGQGYRVFPVNPALEEILGRPVTPASTPPRPLPASETGRGIDLVDVFRASEHVPPLSTT